MENYSMLLVSLFCDLLKLSPHMGKIIECVQFFLCVMCKRSLVLKQPFKVAAR